MFDGCNSFLYEASPDLSLNQSAAQLQPPGMVDFPSGDRWLSVMHAFISAYVSEHVGIHVSALTRMMNVRIWSYMFCCFVHNRLILYNCTWIFTILWPVAKSMIFGILHAELQWYLLIHFNGSEENSVFITVLWGLKHI